MDRNIHYILKESFVPIVAAILSLFLLLLWVNFKIEAEVEDVRIIDIPATTRLAQNEEDDLSDESGHNISFAPSLSEADELISQGKITQALALYRNKLRQEKTSALLTEYAALLYRQKNREQALSVLDEAIGTEPVYPSAWFYRGLIKSKQGHYRQAIADYKKVITRIPTHFESNINLGLSYIKLEQLDEAAARLQYLSEKVGGTRKAMALYYLGTIAKKQDKKPQASVLFQKAIRLKPDYIAARLQLVSLQDKPKSKKEYDRALQAFDKIMTLKPNHAPTYFYLARLHSNAGFTDKAIKAYQQAIQFNPTHYAARKNLGLMYIRSKQWPAALEQFGVLHDQNSKDAKVVFNLGYVEYNLKNHEKAEAYYRNAIKLNGGNYPAAFLNLGLVYRKMGKTNQAIEAYNTAIRQKNDYAPAYYNKAILFLKQKQWKKAEHELKTAIKYNNDYARAWYNLGLLYSKTDQFDAAISAYEKAISIRPDYPAAQLNLAVRHAKKGQFRKSVTLYKQVLSKDPTYASAWKNLGIAYSKLNENENALQALIQAHKLENEDIGIRKQLARTLENLQRFADAEKLYRETLDMQTDDIELRMGLARSLFKMDRKPQARVELKKTLRIAPDNEDAKKLFSSLFNEEHP